MQINWDLNTVSTTHLQVIQIKPYLFLNDDKCNTIFPSSGTAQIMFNVIIYSKNETTRKLSVHSSNAPASY